MRRLLLVLAVIAAALAAVPAHAHTHTYRPPVSAPVVDGFRLPAGSYGPGNRGLEYATAPGTPVRAIGPGLVVWSGRVAGNLAVTVLHPDGLRSSYSYLAAVEVKVNGRVVRGQQLGTAGERLHLGVRAGGAYLDPATLFTTPGLRLVPVDGGAGTLLARS
ncbi:MAG TPA: M23 family metallopeptidase [Acidimicrobiales bacterium]|nr:M23 family metallopeptidase [Acidimicrobiales bacterium]